MAVYHNKCYIYIYIYNEFVTKNLLFKIWWMQQIQLSKLHQGDHTHSLMCRLYHKFYNDKILLVGNWICDVLLWVYQNIKYPNNNHLTDSATLTITYMAVSMVINILTTIPLMSLLILNVLPVYRLLSSGLLKESPDRNRSGQSGMQWCAAQSNNSTHSVQHVHSQVSQVHTSTHT